MSKTMLGISFAEQQIVFSYFTYIGFVCAGAISYTKFIILNYCFIPVSLGLFLIIKYFVIYVKSRKRERDRESSKLNHILMVEIFCVWRVHV